ncbi:MAG: exopolysaccharide biosynthesis polyprenyl glycosylphosphotransferase [bacterium]|nr:exopolysaccharide biosynthesis polyprenyl glycosylphosphotransferase [bacterium]
MYKKSTRGWLKHLDFILLDVICLQISYALAFITRHGWRNPYANITYRNLVIVLILIELITAIFFESYKNVLKRNVLKELAQLVKQIAIIELLISFYLFTVKDADIFSRTVLYLTGIYQLPISLGVRLLWKQYLKHYKANEGKRSLLLVTTDEMAPALIDNIRKYNYKSFRVVGITLLDQEGGAEEELVIQGIPVVSDSAHVVDWACKHWVDEVFFAVPADNAYPEEIIRDFQAMGVVVHTKLAEAAYMSERGQIIERLGGYAVLTSSVSYVTARQQMMKRGLDILGGLVGSLITLLLMVVIAPAIYIKSPGPIFFSQIRVGRNGKQFKMYKFRSMYLDAEERKKELMEKNRVGSDFMFKLDEDPRIIGSRFDSTGRYHKGIGNWLRASSLDEFPQFFNVLKGEMSLVGTRPPTVEEYERYELHHRARLAAKPGITGLWQVSGRSNITDFEEVVKLDMEYIQDWSFSRDLKILFKTVQIVLRGEGSM